MMLTPLSRSLNILTLIYTVIALVTLHFSQHDMKLSHKLLILLSLEYGVNMKIPALLTKILLSQPYQQPKIIIIQRHVNHRNEYLKVNITKCHVHPLREQNALLTMPTINTKFVYVNVYVIAYLLLKGLLEE